MPIDMEQLFRAALESHGITRLKDLSKPTSHFLTIEGVRFHYLDWGGHGEPILFLHGGGQDAWTWEMVCLQLRGMYHCYALDMRGHGKTDKTDGAGGLPQGIRDVEAVRRAIGLGRFAVVGMSMGGLTAMSYAIEYQKDLAALTIVDVTPTITRERRQGTYAFNAKMLFPSLDALLHEAHVANPHRPLAHLRFTLMHMFEEKPDGTWARKRARAQGLPVGTPNTSPTPFRSFDERDGLWSAVAKISCPALIVHGMASNATDYNDAERLAKLIPDATIIHIPDSSHTVQGDKPKPLAAELQKFLGRVL